jgi:adrenodoxin-NADP+ reductase
LKIIGRRGPLQAPYTIKELRELLKMSGLGFAPPPEGWDSLVQVPRKKLPRQLKRIMELLENGSTTPLQQAEKAWQLGYLRSPLEFLSKNGTDLAAVGFEQMEYADDLASLVSGDPHADLNTLRGAKVKGSSAKSMVTGALAFRSIGYASEALAGFEELGIPFDTKAGIIPNDRWGRILDPTQGPGGDLTAAHVPGMYCAGWVKRGPTGVIASTLDDAFTTADVIVKDWQNQVLFHGGVGEGKTGWNAVKLAAQKRGIRSISWEDWEKIDAEEVRRGKETGTEREKCRTAEAMLEILD